MSRHVITLPWDRPPLSLNDRFSRWKTAKITAEIRRDVGWLAKAHKIGPHQHITVGMEWTPKVRRDRDQDNPILTLKACVDALVDVKIIPGDTPEYVTREFPVIHPANRANAGVKLIITTGGDQ